jgi:hypothetical protein
MTSATAEHARVKQAVNIPHIFRIATVPSSLLCSSRRIDVYQAIMTSYIDFSQPSLWSEFLQAPRRLRKQRLTRQQYLRRALRSTLHFGSKWESRCFCSVWLIHISALRHSKVRTVLISTLCILDSTHIHSKRYTDRQEETALTTFRIPQQSDYQAVRW